MNILIKRILGLILAGGVLTGWYAYMYKIMKDISHESFMDGVKAGMTIKELEIMADKLSEISKEKES